jgi:multidrug efflux pump subunit AcrB
VTYSIKKIPGTDILETIDSVKQVVNNYDLDDLKVYEINSQKEKIDSTYKTFLSNFRQTTVIIFIIILLFI